MSLTATTIAGAIASSDRRIALASGTGLNLISPLQKKMLQIDQEQMLITNIVDSPVIRVVRGWNGTQAASHGLGAPAIFGTPSEFQGNAFGAPIQSYGANGAITPPNGDAFIVISKLTAAAMTLADPLAGSTARVTIFSVTAAAHTVTYTAGFYGDTTSSDVATFAAKVGASFTIQAQNGKWGVIATANVTIA